MRNLNIAEPHQELAFAIRESSIFRCIQAAFLACMIAMVSGCAVHADPYRAWQEGVTRYVVNEGHGDLAVLRQIQDAKPQDSLRPDQRTIGILGTHSSADDVQAVLVGTRTFDGQTWFIFVAADLRQQPKGGSVVKDLRLVAVSEKGDDLHWRTGPSDPDTVDKYVRNCTTTLRRPFPASTDEFLLADFPDGVKVEEKRSGAEFTIRLRADASTPTRAVTFRS